MQEESNVPKKGRHKFKKGEVTNPTGKNAFSGPADMERRALLKIMSSETDLPDSTRASMIEAIYTRLCELAKKGDVRAATLVLERFAGKPKQVIEATGADGAPLQAVIILPSSGLDK